MLKHREHDGHWIPFDDLVVSLRTRKDVEEYFDIKGTTITTPGKFEGEERYVPYFWEKALDGWADLEKGNKYTFYVFPSDVEQFPELSNKRDVTICLREDGFVYETNL